jgi:FSR family fosmidomycin resistance protein-like MFS transporter
MYKTAKIPAGRVLLGGGGLTALLALAHLTGDALNSMLPALLPTLQVRFGLTESVLALLVAASWLGSSLTQPLFGALSDRIGRRVVGSVGVIVNTVLLSLLGVVPTVWLLFGVLLVGGFGSAALHPVGTSVARAAGGKNKGLAVGLFSAGGMIGYAIGPVIILYVLSTLGIGATPYLMVPGVLLGVSMWFFMPEEERPPGEPSGEDPLEHGHRKLFDAGLFFGPVGLLAVSGILGSLSLVTFTSAVPLWLVDRGVDPDAPLIGWTLAAFSLSAGISGVVSGALGARVDRRVLVSGSMLLAVGPLIAMFFVETGSLAYFATVALAGGLFYASLPHMILSAQDLAPHAMGAASGMLMGFTSGVAGVLYIGVGWLQEVIGLTPAMVSSYLLMVPAALLALRVLTKNRASLANMMGSGR